VYICCGSHRKKRGVGEGESKGECSCPPEGVTYIMVCGVRRGRERPIGKESVSDFFVDSFWGGRQFPGADLQKITIYLSSEVFARGQLYVALSRARAGDPTNNVGGVIP